jgi:phage N-6-adenine-methyltransferase
MTPHRKTTDASRDDWRTPPGFAERACAPYRIALDAAASEASALAPDYIDAHQDALLMPWYPRSRPFQSGECVWCNPPFSLLHGPGGFVERMASEARRLTVPVIALLPGVIDVAWFHDYVIGGAYPADEVIFVRGRLSFIHPTSGLPVSGNPVGSMIAKWNTHRRSVRLSGMERT